MSEKQYDQHTVDLPVLTHLNAKGEAHMVDVTDKQITYRQASASATVIMRAETLNMIINAEHAKGDVLAVARVAGIQGAKKCSDLIPLCHPLALTSVKIDFEPKVGASGVKASSAALVITSNVKVKGVTGVEMEALTAVSVAALTVYDMCKAVDARMCITETQVLGKSGGKSDWGIVG